MKLRPVFHPQMDGKATHIQTIHYLLRSWIIDFNGYWDKHFPLVEFFYNNIYHPPISIAPFEALYGRKCRSPITWFELGETSLLGPKLIYKTLVKVHIIRNRLKIAYSRQKSYATHRRRDLDSEEND